MEANKIVGYCRVSTLEQRKKGYGIPIQMQEIERHAAERGWRIAEWYTDEAKSGMVERRKALQRLLRDCKAGAITAVILAKLDRFSRSLRLSENLFYTFEQLGVRVYIADLPHYDASDRKEVLMRQIQAAIAEENRKEIIERLKKGREERARKGKMSGGTLAYGYQRVNRAAELLAPETKLVRKIFALRDEGYRIPAIAGVLNSEGQRQRNGKPWSARQVRRILDRRELYAEGIVKYGSVIGMNKGLILLQ